MTIILAGSGRVEDKSTYEDTFEIDPLPRSTLIEINNCLHLTG